jgi:hypothetical protein
MLLYEFNSDFDHICLQKISYRNGYAMFVLSTGSYILVSTTSA